MYLAELHGKLSSQVEGMEDVLTANVLSFFKQPTRIAVTTFVSSGEVCPSSGLSVSKNGLRRYSGSTSSPRTGRLPGHPRFP